MNSTDEPKEPRSGQGKGHKDEDLSTQKILLENLARVIQVGRGGERSGRELTDQEKDLEAATRNFSRKQIKEIQAKIDQLGNLKPGQTKDDKEMMASVMKMVEEIGNKGVVPETESDLFETGPRPEKRIFNYRQWNLEDIAAAVRQTKAVRKSLRDDNYDESKELASLDKIIKSPLAARRDLSAKQRQDLTEQSFPLIEKLADEPDKILMIDIEHGKPKLVLRDPQRLLEKIAVTSDHNKGDGKKIQEVVADLPLKERARRRLVDLVYQASANLKPAERDNLPFILNRFKEEERERLNDIIDIASVEAGDLNLDEPALEEAQERKLNFLFGDFLKNLAARTKNKEITGQAKHFLRNYIAAAYKIARLEHPGRSK